MKIAVYTCIINNYDSLKKYNPEFRNEADFFIFSNNKKFVNEKYYKYIKIKFKGLNNRHTARYHKINSHLFFSDYDYVIYMDGTTMMNTINPKRFIEKYLSDADVCAFKYPDEDCTYIHAEKCKNCGRINDKRIDKQVDYFKSVEFPEHFGLSEVRVVLRKNIPEITKFNKLWWSVYNKFLTCDQLCFDYCIWKIGMKRNWIDFHYPDEPGEHEFITSQQHNYFYPHLY